MSRQASTLNRIRGADSFQAIIYASRKTDLAIDQFSYVGLLRRGHEVLTTQRSRIAHSAAIDTAVGFALMFWMTSSMLYIQSFFLRVLRTGVESLAKLGQFTREQIADKQQVHRLDDGVSLASCIPSQRMQAVESVERSGQ